MARRVNIDKALEQIAGRMIESFKQEITASGRVNSGRLLESFEYEVSDGVLTMTSNAKYAGSVDMGRGPSEKNQEYALKRALAQWIQDKGLSIMNYKYKKDGSRAKNYGRFVKRSGANLNRAAGAMAKKIHRGGYGQKFGVAEFTEKTFVKLSSYIEKTVGEAYLLDIKEMVEQNITNYLRRQ